MKTRKIYICSFDPGVYLYMRPVPGRTIFARTKDSARRANDTAGYTRNDRIRSTYGFTIERVS